MSDTKAPVGYLFQFTCDTGNGKHLTVSGNFDIGADVASMNAEVDKVAVVFDRLRAKHEMPLIEERLDGLRNQLASQEADFEGYMKKYPPTHKSHDETMVTKLQANLASVRVAIVKGEIALAEAQEKAK